MSDRLAEIRRALAETKAMGGNIWAYEQAISNADAEHLLSLLAEKEAEVRKLQQALADAAREIHCAGPVAHRIRVLKRQHGEEGERLEAARDHYCTECEALLKERDELLETATGLREALRLFLVREKRGAGKHPKSTIRY